jgi:hypothetical protein
MTLAATITQRKGEEMLILRPSHCLADQEG